MINATVLKILIGAGIVVGILLAFNAAKNHYIAVGVKQERSAVALAAEKEAARLATVRANAAQDGASRVSAITAAEKKQSGALNVSEVLNHDETNSPCLSDSRRLRIDAVR